MLQLIELSFELLTFPLKTGDSVTSFPNVLT